MTTDTATVARAVARFAGTWKSATLAGEVAPSLSCVEVGQLAGLLRAAGATEAAEEWVRAHVAADETCGEQHDDAERLDEEALRESCSGCGAEAGEPCNPHMGCA